MFSTASSRLCWIRRRRASPQRLRGGRATGRRVRDRVDRIEAAKADGPHLFLEARNNAERCSPGRQSPLRAIAAIEDALHLPFDQGMNSEARLFEESQSSAEHRGLAHLFFAERRARNVPGLSARNP